MVGRGKQCFFDRVVWGGLLGVHHTRGIYAGIKEGQGRGGGDHPRRVERAPFLSRAPRPRATTTPQPRSLSQSSGPDNRVRKRANPV